MNKKADFSVTDLQIKYQMEAISMIAQFYRINGRYPTHGAKDPAERSLGAQLSRLKGAKKGLPYCKWYPQYEKLARELGCPDMFKPVDRIKKTLQVIKAIAKFYHDHGRYPSQYSKDEKKLWIKRTTLKQARKGKGVWKWYPEYDLLAEELGLPNMFEEKDRINERIEVIKKIADFYLKNKRLPQFYSSDPYEKKLSSQLNTIKASKCGKGTKNWDKCYDELVKELGCPEILTLNMNRMGREALIKAVASFFHKNGKYPSRYSIDTDEKNLAERLHTLKRARKGYGRYKWYPEYEKLALKLGCPDMFKIGGGYGKKEF